MSKAGVRARYALRRREKIGPIKCERGAATRGANTKARIGRKKTTHISRERRKKVVESMIDQISKIERYKERGENPPIGQRKRLGVWFAGL